MIKECWMCEDTDIVYTDPTGAGWCAYHFNEFYLQRPDADDSD